MRGKIVALLAALAVAVTLTSCGRNDVNNNTDPNTNGNKSSTGSSQSGSAAGSNARTSARGNRGYHNNSYVYDGRYYANPDGGVAGGRDNLNRDGAARDWDNLGRDITNGTRDLVNGARDAVDDVGNGVRNAARDSMDWQ